MFALARNRNRGGHPLFTKTAFAVAGYWRARAAPSAPPGLSLSCSGESRNNAGRKRIYARGEQLLDEAVSRASTRTLTHCGDTGDQVAAAIGDGSQFGARTTFIQQHAPLGIAHAVATARDFLGDSPFVLYLGDNFVMGGIQSYVDKFTANGSCSQILLHPVANPEA